MTIHSAIQFESIENLSLDPMNPRLGRNVIGQNLKQHEILEKMRDWSLEELAVSYIESGFWPHEALLVVREKLQGKQRLVVVEGNRRLAALMYLNDAVQGRPANREWKEIAALANKKAVDKMVGNIPYVTVDTRSDVQSFLGFRHVTGIKQWHPAEKAEYIAKLVDGGLTYEQVMRRIGSKTSSVKQNYVSFRLLLQIEAEIVGVPAEAVEDRFSVMYLSLRSRGVREYLGLTLDADPKKAKTPVPKARIGKLGHYCVWLFGTEEQEPLFSDSRLLDKFGAILENKKAVEYLERHEKPRFEVASEMAGGNEEEVANLILSSAEKLELALGRLHVYRSSSLVKSAVERLKQDITELLRQFPNDPVGKKSTSKVGG